MFNRTIQSIYKPLTFGLILVVGLVMVSLLQTLDF